MNMRLYKANLAHPKKPAQVVGEFGTRTHQERTSAGVPQNDHAVAEPELVDRLQLQPHAIREEPFSAADDRANDHLKLVVRHDITVAGPGLAAQALRAGLVVSLEPAHYVGIELAFDPRSHAARLGKRSGVDDLLGCLPLPRPFKQ
jgi:hypothetical protein